jgi:hypothetical protein
MASNSKRYQNDRLANVPCNRALVAKGIKGELYARLAPRHIYHHPCLIVIASPNHSLSLYVHIQGCFGLFALFATFDREHLLALVIQVKNRENKSLLPPWTGSSRHISRVPEALLLAAKPQNNDLIPGNHPQTPPGPLGILCTWQQAFSCPEEFGLDEACSALLKKLRVSCWRGWSATTTSTMRRRSERR